MTPSIRNRFIVLGAVGAGTYSSVSVASPIFYLLERPAKYPAPPPPAIRKREK